MRRRGLLKAWAPATLVAVGIAACGWVNGLDDFKRKKGDPPDDEGTGASGAGGMGSTGMGGSSATGSVPCDDLGGCMDPSDPSDCLGCALLGACAGQLEACDVEPTCYEYLDCINLCMDTPCYDACYMQYPVGAAIYNALAICAVCEQCYVSCDGANAGCP